MALIKVAIEQNPNVEAEEVPAEIPPTDGKAPITGMEDNSNMNTHTHSENLLSPNEVKAGLEEAIAAGQPDKIMYFVKELFQQYPDAVEETVKIVKVHLHDAVMNRRLEGEAAVGITQQIDQMLGE